MCGSEAILARVPLPRRKNVASDADNSWAAAGAVGIETTVRARCGCPLPRTPVSLRSRRAVRPDHAPALPALGLCTSRFGSSDTASAWCLRRPPRGRRHLRTRSKRPGPGSGRRQAPLAVADVFDPAGGEEAARVTDGTSPLRRIKLRCPRSAAPVAPMRWLSPSRPPQTCRQCSPFQVIRRKPPPGSGRRNSTGGEASVRGGERELCAQAGAGVLRALEKDSAAERLDAVLESDEARAQGEVGATSPVVAD